MSECQRFMGFSSDLLTHLIFYSANLQRDGSDVHFKVSWPIVFWFSPEGALCNWLSICIM